MEPCSKPIGMALSITQIVMSAAFFLLGMIHGFYGERSVTLGRFFPCWIVALVGNIFKEIWIYRPYSEMAAMYLFFCFYANYDN